MKTNKATAKRIKVTSTGKLLRRASHLNHFNAKKRRVTQLRSKGLRMISGVMGRSILRELA